jgi:trigger factor
VRQEAVAEMKVDYVEETTVRKALTFEIEPEIVEQEIEKKAQDYAKSVKLPGFRPGKVPAHVIKTRFRGQVLEDAVEAIVNRVVHKEMEGRGLRPLATPKVTDLKLEENQPMTFRAVFETLPLVELPEYKGLSVPARTPEVSEEDVDKDIDRLRERAARYEPVEGRPAQNGDFVEVDIHWIPRGGGKAGRDPDAMLEVGSEDNNADLNAKLVGATAGSQGEVQIQYKDDHPSPDLAGRVVDYKFTVKAVKQKIVPPADDELAKDLGDFDTLAALRDEIRKRLTTAAAREIDHEVKEKLVAALVEKAAFEVPEALVERHMTARTESAVRSLAYQGVDPRNVGIDWKEYREKQREESVKAAKADILIDEIANREGVEVLESEVDAEVERIAQRMGKPKAATRKKLQEDGDISAVAARIRESKTLDLIKANARLETR